jgi:hypothetical protein
MAQTGEHRSGVPEQVSPGGVTEHGRRHGVGRQRHRPGDCGREVGARAIERRRDAGRARVAEDHRGSGGVQGEPARGHPVAVHHPLTGRAHDHVDSATANQQRAVVCRDERARSRRIRRQRQLHHDVDHAPRAHCAKQAWRAVPGQRIVHGQLAAGGAPHGAQHQGPRLVDALDHRGGGVSRRHREPPTDDVVEDRQEARRRVDARPGQPGDVAVRVHQRGGAPVGEQRVGADGMLHGAAV